MAFIDAAGAAMLGDDAVAGLTADFGASYGAGATGAALGSGMFIDPVTQSFLGPNMADSVIAKATTPLAETLPVAQGLNAGAFPTELSYSSPGGQPFTPIDGGATAAQGSGLGSSITSGINNLLGTSYTTNQVMPWALGAGALGAYALMPKPTVPGAPNLPGAMNKNAVGFNAQSFTPNNLSRSFAHGGITGLHQSNLGSYSDGGHLLKGPGDGMSDDIPATIAGKQEARLADGEFVVPADVVSHLGNGSTDAGAKHLYKMMDRVRAARTGNPKQGKQIKPEKFLP